MLFPLGRLFPKREQQFKADISGNTERLLITMSYETDNYVPTDAEIEEALTIYNEWLGEAYSTHNDKDLAIAAATEQIRTHSGAHKTFFWIAENNAALIYDVDATIEE